MRIVWQILILGLLSPHISIGICLAKTVPVLSPNLVKNGNFEMPDIKETKLPAFWKSESVKSSAVTITWEDEGFQSKRSVSIATPTGETSGKWESEPIPVEPNTIYTISLWYKCTNRKSFVGEVAIDGHDFYLPSSSIEWSKFSQTFRTNPTTNSVTISLLLWKRANQKIFFDELSLTKEVVSLKASTPVVLLKSGEEKKINVEIENLVNIDQYFDIKLEKEGLKKTKVKLSAEKIIVPAKGKKSVTIDFEFRGKVSPYIIETVKVVMSYSDNPLCSKSIILSVAPRRSHPFLFVNREEIERAKERVEKFAWAKAQYRELLNLANKSLGLETFSWPPKGKWKEFEPYKAASVSGLAYAFTGDESYARKTKEILIGYADKYMADVYPSRYGIPTINDVENLLGESEWLVALVAAYDTIYETLTPQEREYIEREFLRPCAEMRMNIHFRNYQSSNMGLITNAALGIIGYCLQDGTYINRAIYDKDWGFIHRIGHDVLGDGFWWECSTSYHLYALNRGIIPIVEAAYHSGLDLYNYKFPNVDDPWHGDNYFLTQTSLLRPKLQYKTLQMVFDFIVEMSFPNGELPGINQSVAHTIGGGPNLEFAYARIKGNKKNIAWALNQSWSRYGLCQWYYPNALLVGAKEIDKVYGLPRPSANFSYSGLAILRSGQGNRTDDMCLLMDYGDHGGAHGEPDKLNVIFYANSKILIPDGEGYHIRPGHDTWYNQTIAHNTVVVDQRSQYNFVSSGQQGNGVSGKLLYFNANNPEFQTMGAMVDKAYQGVVHYRNLAMTTSYIIDVNDVVAQDEHMYDWVLHSDGKIRTDTNLTFAYKRLGTEDGYQFIENVKKAEIKGGWFAEWKTDDGKGFRIFVLCPEGAEVLIGEAPRSRIKGISPILLLRIKSNKARYISVIQPLGPYSPEVRSIEADISPRPEQEMKLTVDTNQGIEKYLITRDGELIRIEDIVPNLPNIDKMQ